MSDPNQLKRILERWDTRLRLQQSVVWLPRGLMAGLAAGLALAIAARLWPLLPRQSVITVCVLLMLIGMVLALFIVWLWRRTTIQIARRFDLLFDLKERMSAAVELAQGVLAIESPTLVAAQFNQAVKTSTRVNPMGYLPLRTDWREWVGAAIILGALSLAVFLPNPQENVLAQQAAVDEAIAEELEELRDLREVVLDDATLTAEEQAAIVEALDEAIQTLEQRDISQEEALAALDAAERELRDLSGQFAEERQRALQEASGLFDNTAAEDIAKALAEGNFQEAAEALSDLDLENLSPEEQAALGEALGQAADALAESNPELSEALGDAAEALQQGDAAAAGEALGEAGSAIGQLDDAALAQVDEYADQVAQGEGSIAGAAQPGEGGMGQAQAGSQQGQGEQGGGGAGRGEDQGAAQGGQAGDQMPTDNDPGDGGETPYDDVYAPQRIGGEGGEQVDVPGNPDAGMPTGAEGDFADNPFGSSNVDYEEVWADYADAINEALESGYIPLGLRDIIRRYFLRLSPETRR